MEKRLIRVFVSATSDLEPEREVIGEALARFPVPLGWEIKRTALPGEQVPAAIEEVRRSDFFLFMLGADITAPTGAELEAAVEAGVNLVKQQGLLVRSVIIPQLHPEMRAKIV